MISKNSRENRLTHLIIFGFMICFISLPEIFSWFQGGGIYSIWLSAQKMQTRSQFIDVDTGSLRTPFMIGLTLMAWLVAALFRMDMSSRWRAAVLAVSVFGGGFVLDGILEPPITTKYMAARGYVRCPTRDHHVGNGKSRVWFEGYALSSQACSDSPNIIPPH